jgi:hypothetical protein
MTNALLSKGHRLHSMQPVRLAIPVNFDKSFKRKAPHGGSGAFQTRSARFGGRDGIAELMCVRERC